VLTSDDATQFLLTVG